jgi:hypothetical protein
LEEGVAAVAQLGDGLRGKVSADRTLHVRFKRYFERHEVRVVFGSDFYGVSGMVGEGRVTVNRCAPTIIVTGDHAAA